MWIEQENAQIATHGQYLLQDDGNATRLSDPGCTEDGEVFAEQIVDIDVNVDRVVLLKRADIDGIGTGYA